MGDTNELMEFLSASLGATLDEIYQRLIDCDFTREDPGLAMFVVALLNALGREGRGNRPTEVVLMLAYGESGTAERGRNRLMRWLEANADTSQQETAVPTPEQLSNVKMSRELDLFRTTCKVLRIPKAIERIWSRQRLMPWFRAVMTSWMYERAKRHMSRNTEAYQSFQLDIGPGAYMRAFLTHRNAVTTAVKRVAGTPCVTEDEKKEVLRADLERNVSLCLHNSFCRNREQKVNVDLLPCCKPRLLEQESCGTARNSMDMLEKVLEDSEDQDGEVIE